MFPENTENENQALSESGYKKLVTKLKKAVDDIPNVNDNELRRFLIARDYDIEKSEEMFRKSLEWRKTIKFDEAITYKISDNIKQSFPFFFDGLEKTGRIVLYFPVGRWQVRNMLSKGHREEMVQYIYFSMASLISSIENSVSDQFSIIIDLAELSYWKIAHYDTMQLVLQVFRDYEQNFPERLHKAIVINSPWVLNIIFPLIRPLLTGRTMQKVQIFDSDPDKYFPVLMDDISVAGLPSGFQEYNQEMIQSQIIST